MVEGQKCRCRRPQVRDSAGLRGHRTDLAYAGRLGGSRLRVSLDMAVALPAPIALMPEEQACLAEIDFNPVRSGFDDSLRRSCTAARPLAHSLLDRNAIPAIRWAYFTDPRYNVGSNCSHLEVFERNGTRGDEILAHGHFLKFLKYFIEGPDLPKPTIKGFCDLISPFADRGQLRAFARSQIRSFGLDRREAAEEFYKLALECHLDECTARSVRDAARSTR